MDHLIYKKRELDNQERTIWDFLHNVLDSAIVSVSNVETHYENRYPIVSLRIRDEKYSISKIKEYLDSLNLPQVINYADGIGCNEICYNLSYSEYYNSGRCIEIEESK